MSISVGKAEKKLVKMVKTDPNVSSSSGSSRAFMIRIVLPFTPHLKMGPSTLCPSVGLRTGPQGDREGRKDHSKDPQDTSCNLFPTAIAVKCTLLALMPVPLRLSSVSNKMWIISEPTLCGVS